MPTFSRFSPGFFLVPLLGISWPPPHYTTPCTAASSPLLACLLTLIWLAFQACESHQRKPAKSSLPELQTLEASLAQLVDRKLFFGKKGSPKAAVTYSRCNILSTLRYSKSSTTFGTSTHKAFSSPFQSILGHSFNTSPPRTWPRVTVVGFLVIYLLMN